MNIDPPWTFDDDQTITIEGKTYNVHAAIFMARDLPVKELPLDDFYICYKAPCHDTLRSFVAHMKLVESADLSFPIILNEDGCLIDGKHRLAKALLHGYVSIKAVRFIKDPPSTYR